MNQLIATYTAFLLILSAAPLQAAQPELDRANIVVVVDASGSMDGWKMQAARDALKKVLGQLSGDVNVGILVFPHAGWVYDLGPLDRGRLNSAIDAIDSGGGTPLATFIKKGADRLLDQRTKQLNYGSYRLLVVTDGEADYGERSEMERWTPEVVARGITLDVIGVDMDQQHTLAQWAHTYRNAKDPASLESTISQVFAEVTEQEDGGTVGDDVFSVIAPLSTDVCLAAIQTLAETGNHPIGAKPRPYADTSLGQAPSGQAASTPSAGGSGCGCHHHQGQAGWWALLALLSTTVLLLMRRRRSARGTRR
ncbi:hypothetical protein AMJ57_00530 [Parcubacteria bacterium SG8_24]|nr:MAG: hypothetical protein AMJ57_00530 [Parcubacteria bacterium SG8_24]